MSGGFATVQSPAAIQAFMGKNISGPNSGNTFRILSDFEIEVHGNTAIASSRWTFVTPGPTKSRLSRKPADTTNIRSRRRALEIQAPDGVK
jgi:hypothetical protein